MKKAPTKNKKSSSKETKVNYKKSQQLLKKDLKTDSEFGEITSLVLRDHQPIKKLLLVLKDSEAGISKKRPAYIEFEFALSTHAKAEEESLYVHMKEEENLSVEGHEGDTEHAIADQLMTDVSQIKNDDDKWMAKVKVLAELVDHHIKEEEREMLKKVRKEFDLDMRTEIGEEYSRLLNQLRADRRKRVLPTETLNTQADYV